MHLGCSAHCKICQILVRAQCDGSYSFLISVWVIQMKVNWSDWCPVHIGSSLAIWWKSGGDSESVGRDAEGLNNITLMWGRVEMEEKKEGEEICCSSMQWPSADLRQAIITWLFTQTLVFSYSCDHVRMKCTTICFSIWKALIATRNYTYRPLIYKQARFGKCNITWASFKWTPIGNVLKGKYFVKCAY